MGEHVVPAQLAFGDSVESGVLLDRDDFRAGVVVHRGQLGSFVARDEVVFLVAFQVRESSFAQSGSGNNPVVVAIR